MATYRITAPDGGAYEITAPDDATEEQVLTYAQQNYTQAAKPALEAESFNPTDGMGRFDRFAAGFGRSFAEAGRGIKQAGTEAMNRSVRNAAVLASDLGAPGVGMEIARRAGIPLRQSLARQQADIDEARHLDQPLMDTGWGQAGNAAGVATQVLGPAGFARNTAFASSILPSTIRGNVAQGAVLGGLQPTATGESRTDNALLGGGLGGVGAGVVKVAAGAGKAVVNRLRGSPTGASRGAAEEILREAEDPARLMAPQPSLVPGVQRSLAEQSLDPGVARLERVMRGKEHGFDAMDRANHAARVAQVQRIAGTDADMAAAVAARDASSGVARSAAMAAPPAGVDATLKALDAAIEKARGRTAVQPALRALRDRVASYADQAGKVDINTLENVRLDIGDMLAGKFGGESGAALAGSRELIGVRDALNSEIGGQVPEFTAYLNAFRLGSKPINRMEVGRELLDRGAGSAIADATTGVRPLTPAGFSRQAIDLDALAAKATGFAKAKATDILTPPDIAMIKAIQDDLERQAFRATAGSGGNSHTFERMALDSRLGRQAARDVTGKLPYGQYLAGFMENLDKAKNERLKERIAYLLANPDEARRVIAALPPKGQEIVSNALVRIGGAAGAAHAVTTGPDQPLEIDIVGGRAVPLEQFDRGVRP